MAAIITPRFRKNNAAAFKSALSSSNHYLGLGRAQPWQYGLNVSGSDSSTPTATAKGGTEFELIQAKCSIIQMEKIRDTISSVSGFVSRMIPRVDWAEGRKFYQYSNNDISRFYTSAETSPTYPCYCINDNKLYLCKVAGTAGVAPGTAPFHTSGDATLGTYVWTYRMTLQTNSVLNLQNFIAIPDSDSQNLETFTSWYVGIAVDVASADFFTDTPYRQISVLRSGNNGVESYGTNTITARYFSFTTDLTSTPVVGSTITQTGNTASGVVVKVDTTAGANKIYFTHVPTTASVGAGTTPVVTAFTASNATIIITPPAGGTGTSFSYASVAQDLTGFTAHTYTANIPNGDILFLENRQPINHVAGQVEEIRVVIQF